MHSEKTRKKKLKISLFDKILTYFIQFQILQIKYSKARFLRQYFMIYWLKIEPELWAVPFHRSIFFKQISHQKLTLRSASMYC